MVDLIKYLLSVKGGAIDEPLVVLVFMVLQQSYSAEWVSSLGIFIICMDLNISCSKQPSSGQMHRMPAAVHKNAQPNL
jgi:hypothetical protein